MPSSSVRPISLLFSTVAEVPWFSESGYHASFWSRLLDRVMLLNSNDLRSDLNMLERNSEKDEERISGPYVGKQPAMTEQQLST
jgi:hypothetical protein